MQLSTGFATLRAPGDCGGGSVSTTLRVPRRETGPPSTDPCDTFPNNIPDLCNLPAVGWSTPSGRAATRSGVPSTRTAAASDGSQPTAASNSGRADVKSPGGAVGVAPEQVAVVRVES